MNLTLLFPEWTLTAVLLTLLTAEIYKGSKLRSKTHTRSFCNASFLGCFLILVVTFYFLKGSTDTALSGMYLADPLAAFFKVFFIATLLCVIPISAAFFIHRPGVKLEEFYLICWCTLTGMFFLASANDLLVLFLALEIVTLSFYILTAYHKKDLASIEASSKYLIIGSLASAFVIFGISLIYFASGSTLFPAVREFFENDPQNKLVLLGLLLLIAGAGFKSGAAPFHLWVPDVYQGAPTPTVSFLSVGSKAAGFLVLLRLLFDVFPAFHSQREVLFSTLAAMTLIYGTFGALHQSHLKRLLGYSSIGHAGYLLIGIAAGKSGGISAVLYYLLTYATSNLTLFMVMALASPKIQNEEIASYRGLARRAPFLAASVFVSVLSLAGVPGTAGFIGKFLVLMAAVKTGLGWLALLGALAVAVSLYYYLNLIRIVYADEPSDPAPIAISKGYRLVFTLLIAGILVLGLTPEPFIKWTVFVAQSLV